MLQRGDLPPPLGHPGLVRTANESASPGLDLPVDGLDRCLLCASRPAGGLEEDVPDGAHVRFDCLLLHADELLLLLDQSHLPGHACRRYVFRIFELPGVLRVHFHSHEDVHQVLCQIHHNPEHIIPGLHQFVHVRCPDSILLHDGHSDFLHLISLP